MIGMIEQIKSNNRTTRRNELRIRVLTVRTSPADAHTLHDMMMWWSSSSQCVDLDATHERTDSSFLPERECSWYGLSLYRRDRSAAPICMLTHIHTDTKNTHQTHINTHTHTHTCIRIWENSFAENMRTWITHTQFTFSITWTKLFVCLIRLCVCVYIKSWSVSVSVCVCVWCLWTRVHVIETRSYTSIRGARWLWSYSNLFLFGDGYAAMLGGECSIKFARSIFVRNTMRVCVCVYVCCCLKPVVMAVQSIVNSLWRTQYMWTTERPNRSIHTLSDSGMWFIYVAHRAHVCVFINVVVNCQSSSSCRMHRHALYSNYNRLTRQCGGIIVLTASSHFMSTIHNGYGYGSISYKVNNVYSLH